MSYLTDLSLDRIIHGKNLSVYFQPIIENNARNICGYEALIRGPINTPFHSPVALFAAAGKQGRLVELELLCRELSILRFTKLNLSGKLFLNASPATLFQPNFRSGRTLKMLQKIGLDPGRVVIELTEHTPLENYEAVRAALKHYKEMGFEIAMDDLGSGYSGLRMWYELRPDYVKIDRHFIGNIDTDKVKQQFVHSIKNIALELNCKVIAEGIETESEFQFIKKIGLPFSQGYHLARPALLPIRCLTADFFSQRRLTMQPSNRLVSSATVGAISQHVDAISMSTTVESIANLFNKNPELETIPVVAEKKPLGLIRRHCLANLFFSQHGKTLAGKKSIASLIDSHVLLLEDELPIEQASGLISEQAEKQKAVEFIITRKGEYQGIGSVIDLLKIMTNLQIENARYANPLTLLPGNVPMNKHLEQRFKGGSAFVVCYIDLDNFKPYNDCYGYEKGDQIITGLADILREIVTDRDDFIGHLGGDDFVLVSSADNWQQQCDKLLENFAEWVRHRYRPEDQVMGGISGVDRAGNKQFYPQLTLSMGCVCLPPATCNGYQDLAALAVYAKSMAKKTRGNSLFIYNSREINDDFQKQSA